MKTITVFIFSILTSLISFSQTDTTLVTEAVPVTVNTAANEEVYRVKNGIDIPLTIAATGYTLYGFTVVYKRDKTPESVVLALDPSDVNSFDRPVIDNRSKTAKSTSDMFFYGSFGLPLVLLLDKEIRKDAGKIGLLYLQALGITGSLYVTSAMIADRFRPYVYNPNVDMDTRTGGGGKNSFFAGHPGIVATSTFYMAKVYADYHPQMKNKWVLYSLAGAAAVTTGLLRIQAGEHFYSDVIVGVPIGAAVGILVPHFHKNGKNPRLTAYPTYNEGRAGFYASWKLK
jgi:membrane-associated phospholipid phosphatase